MIGIRNLPPRKPVNLMVVDALIRARANVDTLQKWCQGFYAVDEKGLQAEVMSDEACRMCMVGSIRKVTGDHFDTAIKCFSAMEEANRVVDLAHINDDSSVTPEVAHKNVLEAFDRGIAWAKANVEEHQYDQA